MTDKKNIINPDEDFELEGLSNFVEDLNKEGDSPSLNKEQNDIDSILDSGEEIPSFLSSDDSDELNLDDLNLNADDNDEFEFDTNNDEFDTNEFDLSSIDSVEENKNISDEDNISSEEFKNLVESSNSDDNEFTFDSQDNDLDLSGITEMDVTNDKDLFESDDWEKEEKNNTTDVDDDLSAIDNFEFETTHDDFNVSDDSKKDDFSNTFDNFEEDFDDKKLEDIDFESLPSNSFESEVNQHSNSASNSSDEDEFDNTDNDLAEAWGNETVDDENEHFNNAELDTLLDEDTDSNASIVPVPVPVKEGLFSKIKNKFSKKPKDEPKDEDDDSNLKASRNDDESSYINLDSDLDNDRNDSLLSDEDEANKIEEENNKKAKKGNIIKLSVLAVVIAAIAGGTYYIKNNNSNGFGLGTDDGLANNDLPIQKTVNTKNDNKFNDSSLAGNNVVGTPNSGSSLNSLQVTDLKKEILAQVNADRTAMEQRILALEKENGVLKNVINQVQTSIDPDQINRFKIEFNDLNSKTKQLEVQFGDDQSANKVMATNFFAVVKKLNEDIQDVKNTTARQDSLDEQTKRIDNTFKQLVKVKDKAAEDNLTYRVDLIEKRMKFRNPNGDRTFEDKNNVRKVLSEGLFEGDTVKQEQPIPDVKYKYGFVGMIEGVIYLKNQSGDIKDFKVGDVLPGYGEVLKINDNGSVETEKLGTVSFK